MKAMQEKYIDCEDLISERLRIYPSQIQRHAYTTEKIKLDGKFAPVLN
jgi:hypothetical protein